MNAEKKKTNNKQKVENRIQNFVSKWPTCIIDML